MLWVYLGFKVKVSRGLLEPMPRTLEALTAQYLNVRQRTLRTIFIIETVHMLQHDSAVKGSLPDEDFLPG